MDTRITLSVLMLRKYSDLFSTHKNDPAKRALGKLLYDSSKRPLTAKEAERAIEGIKALRGVK
jgi:hypothetical protein